MAKLDTSPEKATTVEQTSKRLKLEQALSIVLLITGGCVLWTTMSLDPPGSPTVPGLMMFVGLIWYISVRLRRWWHHG